MSSSEQMEPCWLLARGLVLLGQEKGPPPPSMAVFLGARMRGLGAVWLGSRVSMTGATCPCGRPGLGAKPLKTAEPTGRSMATGQLASTLWNQLPGVGLQPKPQARRHGGKGLAQS